MFYVLMCVECNSTLGWRVENDKQATPQNEPPFDEFFRRFMRFGAPKKIFQQKKFWTEKFSKIFCFKIGLFVLLSSRRWLLDRP